MSELKIKINQTKDMEWLIHATEDVVNASESDFEAMKGKAWYKRLWETITFSKDNQIHLANGVSNLAKLQEIVIRAVLVVANDNVAATEAIKNNSERIAKLSVVDTLLLKQIRRIKYGGSEGIEFSELSREKQAMLVSLLAMADQNEEKNDDAKRYLSAVMAKAGVTSIDCGWNLNSVELLNMQETELLYRMIIIHRHLMQLELNSPSEIIDELPLSNRRKTQIIDQIMETSKNVLPEFFVEVYKEGSTGCDQIDPIGIEFAHDKTQGKVTEAIDRQSKLEEAVCDDLFGKVGFGKEYIETQDYYLYLKMSDKPASYLEVETFQKVSKKTGKSEELLVRADFPQKHARDFKRWMCVGNDVYAFFSDDKSEDAGVYVIDVLSGEIRPANFSVTPCKFNTTNGHYFVYTEGLEGLVCIDMISGDAHQLKHGDHNHNDRVCTERALYFTDYNRGHEKQIMEYVFETKVERPLFQLPEGFGTTAMACYGDKLFVMYSTRQGEQIYCYDFLLRRHQICVSNIECQRNGVLKFADGWLFAPREKGFPIQFFSFEDASILTIATDCGYTKYVEEGIIKKKWKEENISNRFTRIGQWVYFEKGKNRTVAKVSINKPMELHAVSATFGNGPDDVSKILLELSGKWR